MSRKFDYVGDPSQMRWGPTGTDRRTLSVATGDYVADRSAGYENKALCRTHTVKNNKSVIKHFTKLGIHVTGFLNLTR